MKVCLCAICGNAAGNRSLTAREMMFGFRDEFEYLECAACGCVQIAEIPRDLSKYYPPDYYSFAKPNATAISSGHAMRRTWRRLRYLLHRRILVLDRLIARFRGPVPLYDWLAMAEIEPNSSILDVGSGSGSLLLALRKLGFTDLTGIDPFIETDISYGSLKIYRREITEITGGFDLVILNHSLEHMPDQSLVFKELARIVKAKGSVLIRTPVAGTFAWKHYGVNWVQLDPPRHLFVHTPRSMRILAGTVGLRVTDVVFDSDAFQYWGSEQYLKDIALRDSNSYAVHPAEAVFTADDVRLFEAKAAVLNRTQDGDQARFHLRKD